MKYHITILLISAFSILTLGAVDYPDNVALRNKAGGINLPDLSFSNISIREALDKIGKLSASSDAEVDPAKKGVNLVVHLNESEMNAVRITCEMKGPTLGSALAEIGKLSNLRIVYDRYAIALVPLSEGK